jgi:hypothetical protein
VDNSRLNLSFISPTINGPSEQDNLIPTIKYVCKNTQISFEAENKISGLGNDFALSYNYEKPYNLFI